MLNNSELSTYFDQMAMVLSAGITPEEGLDILKCDAASESGKQLLGIIFRQRVRVSGFGGCHGNTGEFPVMPPLYAYRRKSGNLDHVGFQAFSTTKGGKSFRGASVRPRQPLVN